MSAGIPPQHKSQGKSTLEMPRWLVWPAGLALLAIACVYTSALIFSRFPFYDDEGLMMIAVRGFLDGHPLYDAIYTPYGPVYYFYQLTLHRLTALPLTHDITGILCAVHWVVASIMLGRVAGHVSRSRLVGLFAFIQAVVHLRSMANEPGHPQEIVVLLLAGSLLIAARQPQNRRTLCCLGAIGALLAFTKINVGAFYCIGLMLVLVCRTPFFHSRPAMCWGALLLAASLPFVLMREHLTKPWAREYSTMEALAILSVALIVQRFSSKQISTPRPWFAVTVGFVSVTSVVLGILALSGTSLSATFDCLVLTPSRVMKQFCLPIELPGCVWSAAAALAGAVWVATRVPGSGSTRFLIAAGKGLYGIVGTYLLVSKAGTQMAYLLPWLWLVLVPDQTSSSNQSDGFFREFLAFGALWQGLQAYPVAGTQVAVGTVLLVLVYLICLCDGIKTSITPVLVARLFLLPPRTVRLAQALIVTALLCLVGTKWCPPLAYGEAWAAQTSLDLPGARLVRVPAVRVDMYHELTAYLATHCDTFVTFPGFNSLYFWTGKPPLTYFNACEVVLLDEDAQNEVVAKLKTTAGALIVLNTLTVPFARESDILGTGPLECFIRNQCSEVKRFRTFRILAPNQGTANLEARPMRMEHKPGNV